jgi:hypothetical protein
VGQQATQQAQETPPCISGAGPQKCRRAKPGAMKLEGRTKDAAGSATRKLQLQLLASPPRPWLVLLACVASFSRRSLLSQTLTSARAGRRLVVLDVLVPATCSARARPSQMPGGAEGQGASSRLRRPFKAHSTRPCVESCA